MRKSLFILLMALLTLATSAQNDTTWKKGGKFALTFSQVAFTNWAAGGENSYGGNGFFYLFAHYKEGKRMWDTDLNLAYGLIKLDGESTRKSDDKIDFLTKYGHEIAKNLYFSTNFNFNTQFSKGYKYPNDSVIVSTFMAPAYIQLGVGLDYKPVEYFSLSFLPVTARMTIVSDKNLADIGAYGVDPAIIDSNGIVLKNGKQTRFELGTAIIAMFQKELIKNIELKSKLQLFSNYLEHPENVDVNWDSMLSLKVNKYISTFVGLTLLYDDDINILHDSGDYGPGTQFRQTFGVGLSMDF